MSIQHPAAPTTPPDNNPRPGHPGLPAPTIWPAAVALGAAFLLWGLISSLIISLIGVLLFAFAMAGWIREILHERKS